LGAAEVIYLKTKNSMLGR